MSARMRRAVESIVSPSWSDGGYRGNGDSSPSWYGSNASSGTTALFEGDPKIEWAHRVADRLEGCPSDAYRLMAELFGYDCLSWQWNEAMECLSRNLLPDNHEVESILSAIGAPPPYTEGQAKEDFLELREEERRKGVDVSRWWLVDEPYFSKENLRKHTLRRFGGRR